MDPESARRAVAFYESALEFDEQPDLSRPNGVWDLGSAEAAELAKLAETTYRDVNIGLANQFARFADRGRRRRDGSDRGVQHAAVLSHPPPWGRSGRALHPIYPQFYIFNDPAATIPIAARSANKAMPPYAVDLLEAAVGDLGGHDVVVLGAAYRGGVKETAFSGAHDLVAELAAREAHPRARPAVQRRRTQGHRV